MRTSFWSDVEEYVRDEAAAARVGDAAGGRRGAGARLFEAAALWLRVRRERRELLGLSDAMLHDIGLSRADAIREAGRPLRDFAERLR